MGAAKKIVPTCQEIELLVANLWGWRKNLIVPNISWGAGLHECDLLILTASNWATEVEIKVSRADLKKDAGKEHGHVSDRIKFLYFAIPDHLLDCIEFIPDRAGIILITARDMQHPELGFRASLHRQAQANPTAKKWTDMQRINMGRLGCMRIWTLKKTVIDHKRNTSGND